MKLNTLLLTSAATLMATSVAFAADLPSKKAAPAAGSVAVCKVGGMTGWTLPGSDTCFSVGGWARFEATYDVDDNDSDDGTLDWDEWAGQARIGFDARSNTEVGVVRSFIQLNAEPAVAGSPNLRRAYVQFAGFTAGTKDSIADVMGTQSDALGRWDQGGQGVDYQMKAGNLNLGIGAETPNDNHTAGSSDNPDIVAHLSGSVGSVGFAVAGVAHQACGATCAADSDMGYAVLGNVNVTMNGLRLSVFGGMATNASEYTGYHSTFVDNSTNDLDTNVVGVSALFTQGKVSVWAEYAAYEADQGATSRDANTLAIGASYAIAKGLTFTTEYATDETDDAADSQDSLLLRIQRDF